MDYLHIGKRGARGERGNAALGYIALIAFGWFLFFTVVGWIRAEKERRYGPKAPAAIAAEESITDGYAYEVRF